MKSAGLVMMLLSCFLMGFIAGRGAAASVNERCASKEGAKP